MSVPERKSRVFKFRTFKTCPELIPVAILPISVVCLGLTYIIYGLITKPDVIINKKQELPPWERVNPEKTVKVMRIGQEYKPIQELEQLKKELGDR